MTNADSVIKYLKDLTPTAYVAILSSTINDSINNSARNLTADEYKLKLEAIEKILSL